MIGGERVRIKRYPHLTGVIKHGTHHVTYRTDEGDVTPREPRVLVVWDERHGTPTTTTIMERLVEVIP